MKGEKNMTIQEMTKKIAEVEKEREVSIYFKYDCYILCYVFLMSNNKYELTRNVPVTEIMTWDIGMLELYLNEMAHDLEIGVLS
jgi:hypothetical protein